MGNQNGHRTTFPGVYSCTLDVASGRCDESMPLNIVVDSVHTDQTRKRGVDVSNLKLSASKDMLFALRTDNLWEILRAPLAGDTDDDATSSGSTATFHSYFRIPKLVYTDPRLPDETADTLIPALEWCEYCLYHTRMLSHPHERMM